MKMKSKRITYLKLRVKATGTTTAMALLGEIGDYLKYGAETFGILQYPYVPSKRRRQFTYLCEKEYIRARRIGDRLEVCLTEEGVKRIMRERMRSIKAKLPKHLICLVIFDFPESEHLRRDQWRRFLKWLGMTQLQKSVWTTDRDIAHLLTQFVKNGELTDWIHVLVAEQLTQNKLKNER